MIKIKKYKFIIVIHMSFYNGSRNTIKLGVGSSLVQTGVFSGSMYLGC